MTRHQVVIAIIFLISSGIYAMPQDIVFPGETTLPFTTSTESPTTSDEIVFPGETTVPSVTTTSTTEGITEPSITWTTVALPPNYYACLHDCRTIASYKPVCGTDGVVYQNIYKLNCSNTCGNKVEKFKDGQCRDNWRPKTVAPINVQ